MFIDVKKCFTDPKHLLRLTVVIICICVACYQISECCRKIMYPPKTTHYSFQLNKTMNYPAITICRNPAFKTSVYEKYGIHGDIRYTKSWKNFKFSQYTLKDFFMEATYNFEEFVPLYGFDGFDTNVTVTSFYTLTFGKCSKLTSKNLSPLWSSDAGYFFYMLHTELPKKSWKNNDLVTIRHAYAMKHNLLQRTSETGFHIFVHDRTEMFTENSNQEDSFMEYMYMVPGEDLEIDLSPQEFSQLPIKTDKCRVHFNYSQSKCKEKCLYETITNEVGCSTPWMQNKKLPMCADYESIRKIIQFYNYNEQRGTYNDICRCMKSCNIVIHTPYVRYRKDTGLKGSALSIYFSSNLVTKMQEVMAYDWNLFLADLGGSLGFLLGLSVLSTVGALEQMFELIMFKKKTKEIGVDEICPEPISSEDKQQIKQYLNENKKADDELNNYKSNLDKSEFCSSKENGLFMHNKY